MEAIERRCDADVWEGPPEAIPRDELLRRVGGKEGAVTLLTVVHGWLPDVERWLL